MLSSIDSVIDPHAVTFFASAADLAAVVHPFVAAGLDAGEPALLVVRPEHRGLAGTDDRIVELDAAETLARCSRDGRVDAGAFEATIGGLLADLRERGASVPRVYGEMVGVLWERGEVQEALALEDLWNDLGARQPFRLLCGYPSTLQGAGLADVCSRHTGVLRDGQPEAWRRFDADPTAPRAARSFVLGALRRFERDAVADSGALVVSELTTNVVLHTGSPFTVAVAATPAGARISVHDRSSMVPEARDITVGSSTGRGLQLVDALAASWGTDLADDGVGKVVWAEVAAAG